MNFKIINDEDSAIKVQLEFTVDTWDELRLAMEEFDEYFGV